MVQMSPIVKAAKGIRISGSSFCWMPTASSILEAVDVSVLPWKRADWTMAAALLADRPYGKLGVQTSFPVLGVMAHIPE